MPGDRRHRYPAAPFLTCLPAQDYFLLRPQLLIRVQALPKGALTMAPGTD
jgi:hypothetical protein